MSDFIRFSSARDIGPMLRTLRLEQGVTQRDVAEAAGIDEPNLCAYEKGRRVPDPDTIVRVLTALGHEFAVVRKERRKQ